MDKWTAGQDVCYNNLTVGPIRSRNRKKGTMKITTLGRGSIGGTLARLWTEAGHEVTTLGHDGGDVGDADVVLLAVPSEAVPEALTRFTGLQGKVVLDATNRMTAAPPAGHASIAEYVKAQTGGPTAKAFNLNFGSLLEQAAQVSSRPGNIWVGDEDARSAVEQLTRDVGMEPLHAGPLELAAAAETFAAMFVNIMRDLDQGLLYYRFATPESL
jgi:8-hydroxy-5-deazaflavin:NADPH oxidoreductase